MFSPKWRGKRILFVEDNEDTLEMMMMVFEQCGYEVTPARTSAEAIQRAQSERFDLYILDSRLPDGRGIDLCRQIRSIDTQTPILFYSAAAYEADKQQAIAAGAQGYITKPATAAELDAAIANLLNEEECLSKS